VTDRQWTGTMLLRGNTKLVLCMRTGVQGVKVREDTCAVERALVACD
jgi:hypothetical protein